MSGRALSPAILRRRLLASVVFLSMPLAALIAEETTSYQIRALSGAAGVRYREPAEDPESVEAFGRHSRADHALAGGVDIEAESTRTEGQPFFYKAQLAVFMMIGRALQLDPESKEQSSILEAVPGDNLYAGINLSDSPQREAAVVAGRVAPDDDLDDLLGGGHGALSGIHLRWRESELLRLLLTPVHRPNLAGDFLAESASADGAPLYAPLQFRRSFQSAARDAESYGYRGVAIAGRSLRLALSYGLNRQNATRRVVGDDRFPPAVDYIENSGIGLGFALGESWRVQGGLNYERSRGEYASELWNDQSRPRQRIDGACLRGTLKLDGPGLFIGINFLLPTPPDPEQGSQPRSAERSGYVGFGGRPLNSIILGDALDMRPWPELCDDPEACQGLQRRADEIAMRRSAALVALAFGLHNDSGGVSVEAVLLTPLAPAPGRGNPFQRLRADPEALRHGEARISLWRSIGAEQRIALQYSRAYRRYGRRGKTELLGESLALAVELPL